MISGDSGLPCNGDRVGLPGIYVGIVSVSSAVEITVGNKVGLPGKYSGAKEGCGVGSPGT